MRSREKVAQLKMQLREMSVPNGIYRGKITTVIGTAKFTSKHTVHVESQDAGQSREIRGEYFIVATGSRPRTLPDLHVDGDRIMTSDHLMQLKKFPKSLVILGAGVVGCEFAHDLCKLW